MSEYKFSCPYCAQHLAGTEAWAGKLLQCPSCRKEFSVPPPPTTAPLPAPNLPPPLPAAAAPPLLPAGGLRIAGGAREAAAAPETASAAGEIEQRVLSGGRYVVFQYCISVLVMSFRRPSGIVYVPPGKDGFGAALGHSLISLVVGWWGIPWGPIWTLSTVFKNAQGGMDVTQEVLTGEVGAMRAANIMARRRMVPPTGKGMKMFRLVMAVVGVLLLVPLIIMVVAFISGMTSSVRQTVTARTTLSHSGGFQSANASINVNHGTIAFGNSPQAVAVAQQFATNMKLLREAMFEKSKASGFSATKNEFLTHCELREDSCAFIVHVPELRKFTAEAQADMGSVAWANAQATLIKMDILKPGMKVAVGLRGDILYDRVLIGIRITDPKEKKLGLTQTITASHPEAALVSYFP